MGGLPEPPGCALSWEEHFCARHVLIILLIWKPKSLLPQHSLLIFLHNVFDISETGQSEENEH